MSKMKFVPEGELEEAIAKKRNSLIIQLTVEAYGKDGCGLARPDILATREFFSLPLRTAAVVIACGMNDSMRQEALSFMKRLYPESEVIGLMEDVERVPETESSPDEKKLMWAITAGDDRKIRRLIEEDAVSLRSLASERCAVLCRTLWNLTPYTVVLLLARGLHYASVPRLLNFLLRECEYADCLRDLDYKERLLLTNLLIHILQKEITPEDDDLIEQDWYPMGNSIEDDCDHRVYCHSYSYYHDPQHIYKPRLANGECEKPKHSIRRKGDGMI